MIGEDDPRISGRTEDREGKEIKTCLPEHLTIRELVEMACRLGCDIKISLVKREKIARR